VGQERLGGLTCIGAHIDDGRKLEARSRFLIVSKTRFTLMLCSCRRFAAQCDSLAEASGGIKDFRGG
jgi:hypothetical protein